ncbi:MarR family transcriptional regulator [Anabaena cylindrica FACHB-243]|uniref:Regulatory protein MarR n=1 Tax=Anabaena cylindrica (strain ATCC 27899 / PCC 7122) TaxID=272123 RepID=K9ZKD7_ANACC|nr:MULTISPECIES: MarR family transcriptional regulator [Anabaena]AFZ58785.1 regulatory protein MarR [Anabaena cylindrica PCC 7122]MBD2420126.1 MarR family transcriptional regulator [Anabaena cylindrica FACHB-243]MBY5285360.1 MarR family transcriptional regulator [Anabaena sp. CCAP 1446/1C]MBY5306599.1 MarR family transcriptional regulator [Anabaena sp. CCAP 1446/1C]MCM2406976.1 MarR family transcriptional regulator [Anabaena sp. CCAP 1446/1C]
MNKDRIDIILEEWQQEVPQLDTSALGISGRILRIARLLEKHRESILVEYGLNVWSFDVLATLRRQGQPFCLKPTELYNLLMLSSGAMTNRIDRLEQDGIVTRVRDAEDRRSVMVQLTPKGIQLADTVMPILFEKEKQLLSQFTADELQLFIPMLRKLLLLLEQDAKSV